MKVEKLIVISFSLMLFFSSCSSKNNSRDNLVIQEGDTMKLMLNDVIKFNEKEGLQNTDSIKFRIIVYGNAYCQPCWEKFLLWKEILPHFQKFSQVEFLSYVYASPEDFKKLNMEEKFEFPVFLDTKEKFRIVNRLSNITEDLTFLVNSDNKVLYIGSPYSRSDYVKYIDIINSSLGD